jgi:hypothetical protein
MLMWFLYTARKTSSIAGMKILLQTDKSEEPHDGRLDRNSQLA